MLTPIMSLLQGPVSHTLSLFLVQVFIILLLVRLVGRALHRIKQPMVIGEIIAGILLGPSALGNIPGFTDSIFPPDSLVTLKLFADVGLIFFMFFLGLEVEPTMLAQNWKASIPIAISSIAVPFASGAVLSIWLYEIEDTDASFTTFLLFMGTALSFTAFPVLARILTSARLLLSPAGAQSLACAAVDDLLGWCTLALVLSYANGDGIIPGLQIAAIAVGYILFLVFVARPSILYIYRRLKDQLNRTFVAFLFLGLLLSSWFAEILGIHAFFGAFVFGIICPKEGILVENLAPKIELIIVEFFLPLYFANSGIRTSIGALNTGEVWGATFVVIGAAIFSKVTPVMLVARWVSKQDNSWRTSLTMGILMNTRGLVALIVLNIGLDQGIMKSKVFSLMVVMALVTTFMTSPLLYVLYEKPYHAAQKALDEQITADKDMNGKLQREPSLSSVHVSVRDAEGNTHVVDPEEIVKIVEKEDIDHDEKYISTRRHKLTSPTLINTVLSSHNATHVPSASASSSNLHQMSRIINGSVHQLVAPITRSRVATAHSQHSQDRTAYHHNGSDDEFQLHSSHGTPRTHTTTTAASIPSSHMDHGAVHFHLDRTHLVDQQDVPSDEDRPERVYQPRIIPVSVPEHQREGSISTTTTETDPGAPNGTTTSSPIIAPTIIEETPTPQHVINVTVDTSTPMIGQEAV